MANRKMKLTSPEERAGRACDGYIKPCSSVTQEIRAALVELVSVARAGTFGFIYTQELADMVNEILPEDQRIK